jgi:hypothetical protein
VNDGYPAENNPIAETVTYHYQIIQQNCTPLVRAEGFAITSCYYVDSTHRIIYLSILPIALFVRSSGKKLAYNRAKHHYPDGVSFCHA